MAAFPAPPPCSQCSQVVDNPVCPRVLGEDEKQRMVLGVCLGFFLLRNQIEEK